MLETLRSWLNGNREYYSGVAIYASVGTNQDLLSLLKDGRNEFRERRLQDELLSICKKLKNIQYGNIQYAVTTTTSVKKSKETGFSSRNNYQKSSSEKGVIIPEDKKPVNEDLYNACKLEADKLYKQVMNDRAILFAMAKSESFEDPNSPDRIQTRAKLAIDVVTGYQQVSILYDQADYVKIHGHLADHSEAEESEFDHLPDNLVKVTLDNIRKNYNKMVKREQTPERIALLQKHEINIKKLEARWLLLKPK